jgi:uncharacterized protein (TIGR02466 family)
MEELKETILFATSCVSTYLDSIDNNSIIESIESLQNLDQGRQRSNIGGYQSNGIQIPQYDNDTTQKLFENHIIPAAKKIKTAWSIPDNMGQAAYWYNVNPRHSSNREHAHHDSFLSGVYYIQVPKNSGNIMFLRSALEADRMNFIGEILYNNKIDISTPHLFTEYRMVPRQGLLLLFPGHLTHYVEQNITEDVRIKIITNTNVVDRNYTNVYKPHISNIDFETAPNMIHVYGIESNDSTFSFNFYS